MNLVRDIDNIITLCQSDIDEWMRMYPGEENAAVPQHYRDEIINAIKRWLVTIKMNSGVNDTETKKLFNVFIKGLIRCLDIEKEKTKHGITNSAV